MTTASAPPATSRTGDPPSSRYVRALLYVPVGLLGGVIVFVVGLLGYALSGLLFDGGSLLVVGGIVLATAFGLARLGLVGWAIASSDDLRPWVRTLRLPWLVVSLLGGTVVVALTFRYAAPVAMAVPLGGAIVSLAVTSVLDLEGEFDPDSAHLRIRGRSIDVRHVESIRRLSVGPVVVFRLSYRQGSTDFRTPRTLIVPASAAPAIDRILDWGRIQTLTDGAATTLTDPLARRLLLWGGTGLLFVAVGLFVVLAEGGADAFARGYIALVVGLFGLVFIVVGLTEG